MSKRNVILGAGLVGLLGVGYLIYGGGRLQDAGELSPAHVAPEAHAVRQRTRSLTTSATATPANIYFGDLHVHTTFSADAFMRSLPLVGGEGAHPPADACDFARFCAQLDFFALTDHAESLTPHHWRETREAVRACEAASAGPEPDVIPYTGFEWTQVGRTAEEHYGHKNVIFPDTADDRLPARPITAQGLAARSFQTAGAGLSLLTLASVPIVEFEDRQTYLDLAQLNLSLADLDACPDDVPSRALPPDCREVAPTPQQLFEKLADWDLDALVIPHGTTWGFYTPPGYTYDKALRPENRAPETERLLEVFSGHGNSEEYRPWRASVLGDDGKLSCPEASEGYEPCCQRAGQIIGARCRAAGLPEAECEARAAAARTAYAQGGASGHLTVPGATIEDWGQCGQCTDCYLPAFQYRPGAAAQYVLARAHFEANSPPAHVKMGFMASSDNHSARPGTGYKEYGRRRMTEAAGARDESTYRRIFDPGEAAATAATPVSAELLKHTLPWRIVDAERQGGFFLTGGLVAVHAAARDRRAIWEGLRARNVYGTSGPRILLWFDLEDPERGPQPMGSEVRIAGTPRFSVRAAGSFVQKPGCPDWVEARIGAERQTALCADECYHPGDARHPITRIEVIRVRLQTKPEERIEELIEDPWRSLPCPEGRAVCEVRFEDEDPPEPGREVAYYVRAIQAPTPTVGADPLRCSDDGCDPCYADYRTPFGDDCLAPAEERAWSSPIWVRGGEARP